MALTRKQRKFIDEYLVDFNATRAATEAGYSKKTAYSIGWENLRKPEIKQEINKMLESKVMSREEALSRLAERARFDVSEYITDYGRVKSLDVDKMIKDGYGHLIRGLKQTPKGGTVVEWSSPDDALDRLLKEINPVGSKDNPLHTNITVSITDESD